MSRIGKKPVPVPSKVTATVAGQTVKVKGPKGVLSMPMSDDIAYEIGASEIGVNPANETKRARAFWGAALVVFGLAILLTLQFVAMWTAFFILMPFYTRGESTSRVPDRVTSSHD